MLMKWIHLFELCFWMQFTIRAVASNEWAVWYNPEELCAFKNSSVYFNCTYDYPSGDIKTFKWIKPGPQRNQKIIVYHSKPEKVHPSYKGRTELTSENKNCSLRLRNVSESDVGNYLFSFKTQHKAWTGEGGTYLNVAVLPFRVAVNSSRTDDFVQEGDKVNLTCASERCTPSGIHITWYKNGVPLFHVKSKALNFNSVSPSDFGNYTCGLNYNDSSTAPEILLDVRYGPKNVSLAVQSTGTIQSGNSLTIICHGYANPPVKRYSLFKMNKTDVSQIGWGRNYTIPAVNPGDSGQYFCLAENELGSQNSTVVSVQVEDPEHLLFVPAALGALLFGVIVAVALLYIIKRKKQSSTINESSQKLPKAEYTPGLQSSQGPRSLPNLQMPAAIKSEGDFDNLAVQCNSDPVEPHLTYAELQFQPPSSERSGWTTQEDISVVYSSVRTQGRHAGATQEPE